MSETVPEISGYFLSDRKIVSSSSILYEDNHIISVFKPAGVLSQGDKSGELSLLDHVRDWIKEKYQKPGNVFLGLIHRLDRPVSGVIVFGKTSKGAARLSEQFRKRSVEKIYHAIVEGTSPEPERRLEHYMVEEEKSSRKSVHAHAVSKGKPAKMSYKVLGRKKDAMLLEVHLETGRKHQIRAQLAHVGLPIRGDAAYGARTAFKKGAIALESRKIVFNHPVRTEEKVTISLRNDLSVVEEAWKR